MSKNVRFLLYHKQNTSARTLFLKLKGGHVLMPEPLPFLSSPLKAVTPGGVHPATLGLSLAESLGWPSELLEVDPDFHEGVETPTGIVDIHLARFTTIDPPHLWVSETVGAFCAITELRGGHPVEMAMLRKSYEHILGG